MACHRALGHGVHHAGLRQDVNPVRFGRPAVRSRAGIAHRGHDRPLDHPIGQQFVGDPHRLAAVEVALDQVSAASDGSLVVHARLHAAGRRTTARCNSAAAAATSRAPRSGWPSAA